jgi:hypothetical protein
MNYFSFLTVLRGDHGVITMSQSVDWPRKASHRSGLSSVVVCNSDQFPPVTVRARCVACRDLLSNGRPLYSIISCLY